MSNNQTDNSGKFNRRKFLNGILPVVAGTATLPSWAADVRSKSMEEGQDLPNANSFPGLITREKEPINVEFPFPTLKSHIIPNNRFFIRTHFPIPKIEAASWELSIEGAVRKEFIINYEELRKMPSKTVMATIECAGNSLSFLVPRAKGLLWEQEGVGNDGWTGVPLSLLLDKAGIKDGTIEIILEGKDPTVRTQVGNNPHAHYRLADHKADLTPVPSGTRYRLLTILMIAIMNPALTGITCLPALGGFCFFSNHILCLTALGKDFV